MQPSLRNSMNRIKSDLINLINLIDLINPDKSKGRWIKVGADLLPLLLVPGGGVRTGDGSEQSARAVDRGGGGQQTQGKQESDSRLESDSRHESHPPATFRNVRNSSRIGNELKLLQVGVCVYTSHGAFFVCGS